MDFDHKRTKKLISRKEAKASIRHRGLTIREWAENHKLNPKTVFEVLSGRQKGHWGEAHRAAVILGIKDGIIE